MNMCVYVCMYVCMYVRACVHAHTCSITCVTLTYILNIFDDDEHEGAMQILIRHRVKQPQVIHPQGILQVQDGVKKFVPELNGRR